MSESERLGSFIVVAGIDGAGKTSVSTSLARRRGGPTVWLSHRGIPELEPPFLTEHLARLASAIWEKPGDPQDLLGHRHFLHLLAGWYCALDLLVIRPNLAAGRDIVCDGWIYKTVARAASRDDISPALKAESFAGLSEPDVVILLDVDPKTCATRKETITDAEAGRHDGWGGDLLQSFVQHQSMVQRQLRTDLERCKALKVVDGNLSFEDVVAECERALEDVLSAP
jgi:dTMP kinase